MVWTTDTNYWLSFSRSICCWQAADNPTVYEIRDVCQSQGLNCELEVGVYESCSHSAVFYWKSASLIWLVLSFDDSTIRLWAHNFYCMIVSKDKNKLNKLHRNVEQIIYLSKYKSTKSFKILSESSSDILKVQSGHYLVYKHTLLGLLCKINIIFEILICNFFLPMGYWVFHKKLSRNACAFQDQIGIEKCWFFWGEGKTGVPEEKLLRAENQQTWSTCDTRSNNRTQDTLVGGASSHHCAFPCATIYSVQDSNLANQIMAFVMEY